MGHVDGGDGAKRLKTMELLTQLVADTRIEMADRLVEEEDLGPLDQGSRQRDTLHLPARGLVRSTPQQLLDSQDPSHLGDARLDLSAR